METLVHDGVTYVKVTTLAKKYKYTTDYIGQLCRAGKVECQLVGRAWFAEEASLLSHKAIRNKQSSPNEVLAKVSVISAIDTTQKTAVYPRVSKHVHKHFEVRALPAETIPGDTTVGYATSSYLPDDASAHVPIAVHLKGQLHDDQLSAVIETKAKVEHISIINETKKAIKLSFSPLPEVTLRGNILVQSLDTEEKYHKSEPVVLSDFSYETKKFISPHLPQMPVVAVKNGSQYSAVAVEKPILTTTDFLLQPKALGSSRTSFLLGQLFLPLVVVGSLTCVMVILSFSNSVVSDGFIQNQSWQFNVSQAVTAVRFLFESTP